jgi:hypothetical protein
MKKILPLSLLAATAFLVASCGHHPEADSDELRWVYPGDDGQLVYETDARGNRIPDFSNAGYMGGGVAIPDVEAKITLDPAEGDDTERLQAAIDEVAGMELDENGFRGAILLTRGTYEVETSLNIAASGIILRGEGQGEDGTTIVATGNTRRNILNIAGQGRHQEVEGTRRQIVDDYVPVGARSFEVESSEDYAVGDKIAVFRPSTAEWISKIGMAEIPPRRDGLPVTQWTAGSRDFFYDRIITAIDGNRITIDAPVFAALDQEFGGGSIYKYEFPGRISQVGIEHLRGVSQFAGDPEDNDEDHGWAFITLDAVENAWVRNVTSHHFGFGLAYVLRTAKWVTVQDSICLDPVSVVRGSRRYPFYLSGQLGLVQRCYANFSRHDFGINSLVPGPNVFLDCYAEESYADTGPHHRWATGALFDNVRVPDHSIRIINRLNLGSGHGWAGANMVIWNSEADHYIIQNPPTAQNWAIGNVGTVREAPFSGDPAYIVSHGEPVDPASLYLSQLRERLGEEAVQNISIMDIREPIQIRSHLWE